MKGERRDGERTPHCEIKLYCGNTVTHLTLRDKTVGRIQLRLLNAI